MEIIVVTGFARNEDAIKQCCLKLALDGYKQLSNYAEHDAHPADITRAVENEVLRLHDRFPKCKCYLKTNSDHAINALRVLRFNEKIDVLKIKHFGAEGKEFDIEVDEHGEPDSYPDGFLDEWPHMMGNLASKQL